MESAKVRSLWLVVECTHCNAPNVIHKYVKENTAFELLKKRYEVCEYCDKGFYIEIAEQTQSLDYG